MNLPEDHPSRLDLLRKYSAIYGRFDSKRKMEKYMNMHEVCLETNLNMDVFLYLSPSLTSIGIN